MSELRTSSIYLLIMVLFIGQFLYTGHSGLVIGDRKCLPYNAHTPLEHRLVQNLGTQRKPVHTQELAALEIPVLELYSGKKHIIAKNTATISKRNMNKSNMSPYYFHT